MSEMLLEILGIVGALLFLVGDLPYFIDTLTGKTQPQRVTWGVVFILNSIALANQIAVGATNSLWLFIAAVVATGAIFLASIKNGVGGHSKSDVFALVASLFGIALWVTFDSPLMSILANLFVGIVSIQPTFAKARKNPESETRISWLLATISALMVTVSVGEINFEQQILPFSAAILQGYMVYLLYFRPNHTSATK